MRKTLWVVMIFVPMTVTHAQFTVKNGKTTSLKYDRDEASVVKSAAELFEKDFNNVFSERLSDKKGKAHIIVGTLGSHLIEGKYKKAAIALKGKAQAFLIKVMPDNTLLVAGSDAHGTAYGLMELSRMIGVSPWEWWADVVPEKKSEFTLSNNFTLMQSPSVEYRGIFINDEDWGLNPWSSQTYEKTSLKGEIGPETNARIFELLLRLKANTYWPAMHECTVPFFLTKGNREMAAKYGIYMGGSHCEPMACSTAGEWPRRGKGEYDYVNNSSNVKQFWESRVQEVAHQDIFYTIGMRGVHDGAMNGAKTVEEQKKVLARVFKDQRDILAKYVNEDVTQVPQVFIPYKEVQDVYNAGLEVLDDVTLMWCDDNYGYIRHFPTSEERARKGGNGVYYHVSYWGRPHDYLWLGTFSPYLLYQQMKTAYERGIQKLWILNVGDIKPAEYQIELFLDMAWNIEKVEKEGVTGHINGSLTREFGQEIGQKLCPIMQEYYRLAYIHKPEFMGNTRVEESNREKYGTVNDLPWSVETIDKRLEDYKQLSNKVEEIWKTIPTDRSNAYFQLVKYPVQASDQMNRKLLYAQLARHGAPCWDKSDAAFDSIVTLTRTYNAGIDNRGKWDKIMDYRPRNLIVFNRVRRDTLRTPLPQTDDVLFKRNATDCDEGNVIPCEGLGYEGKAALLETGKSISFSFDGDLSEAYVNLCFVPTHPLTGDQLRVEVTFDRGVPFTIDYATKGRSEQWKLNTLWNRAVNTTRFTLNGRKSHIITLKAIDEGIILDQIIVSKGRIIR
ncbi:MAG: glycosyl hydrolase 115 family protein [Paraprevotella sp.]|nr:glycosyl hydrolase 115 family protein [Paraprevotella sp.]